MANFTRLAIRKTFLHLLTQMSLDKITVKMIVDACGVSRNTFYYHYEDIPALLSDVLEAELVQFSPDPAQRKTEYLQLLTKISENKAIFDHIYHSSAREHLRVRLRESMLSLILLQVQQLSQEQLDPAMQQSIAVFFTGAVTGLCAHWLENSATQTPEALLSNFSLFDGLLEEAVRRAVTEQHKT